MDTQPDHLFQNPVSGFIHWQSLKSKRGAALEGHYIELLRALGNRKGMLGQIFTKAQNKIQDPAKLYRLIDMVDDTDWVMMGADIKGDIYEGLLEKNAEDTKSGAGQYFTPRALICAMVECVRPEPGKTIADPACGTGVVFSWRPMTSSPTRITSNSTRRKRPFSSTTPSTATRSWRIRAGCA